MNSTPPLVDRKAVRNSVKPPRTWGELKVAIAAAGVKDEDPVYLLDIGCQRDQIVVDRDKTGVEVTDY